VSRIVPPIHPPHARGTPKRVATIPAREHRSYALNWPTPSVTYREYLMRTNGDELGMMAQGNLRGGSATTTGNG